MDHRYGGTEVNEQEVFIATRTRKNHFIETTKGVEVLVQWKDVSTTWVTLKDTKNSFYVKIVEYGVQPDITGTPEFS